MSTMPPMRAVVDERTAQFDRALVAAFLENIPDKVFFKDRDSRFLAVSRSLARNFGRTTATEVIGRTDFDFFSDQHARSAHDDEQRIIRTGQPVVGIVVAKRSTTNQMPY